MMQARRWPASTWTVPLVFAVLYALWPILHLPRFYYAPETREILWQRVPGMVLMGWYGLLTMAAAAAVVLGGALGWVLDRRPAPWQRFGPWITAAGVLLALIITAARETARWIV